MTYPVRLTLTKGGIDRQRPSGSPSQDVLYDFVNGYRNQALVAVNRPGSVCVNDLPPATKGFVIYRGIKYVFSHQFADAGDDDVICEVLLHPIVPGMALRRIHFAGPFLQYLYVVAEFLNGSIFHYWLRRGATWAPETRHQLGDLVEPTTPNGYVYQARRIGDPNPLWAREVPRVVGDRVEPTTADGNYYEVIDTLGAAPRSGAIEPTWNTEDGALTYEDTEGADVPQPPSTGPTTPPSTPGVGIEDRYGNSAGSRPGWRREQ